jgi:uncharacterized paraquat-inducible protein A
VKVRRTGRRESLEEMPWTTCPLCEGTLLIPRSLKVESTLFCPRCDCLLQVVSIDPPEVDFPLKMSSASEDPKLGRRSGRSQRGK